MNTEERKLIQNLKRIQDEAEFVVAFEEVQRIFGEDTRERVPQKIWGRYQNIIWRDRHEEWEHDGRRYMSGDNFRSVDEWFDLPNLPEKDVPKNLRGPLCRYKLVYRRGHVYISEYYGNADEMLVLHKALTGEGSWFVPATSCAPFIDIEEQPRILQHAEELRKAYPDAPTRQLMTMAQWKTRGDEIFQIYLYGLDMVGNWKKIETMRDVFIRDEEDCIKSEGFRLERPLQMEYWDSCKMPGATIAVIRCRKIKK